MASRSVWAFKSVCMRTSIEDTIKVRHKPLIRNINSNIIIKLSKDL
jgi:hypothetical protein